MAFLFFLRRGIVVFLLTATCSQTIASVVITGTRLIYPADEKEITVSLNNNGEQPVLVQAWMDSGDPLSNASEAVAPFVLSPPVFRMDPKAVQSLRVIFTAADLPKDKESIFWFNLLEIPSLPSEAVTANMLQMAFRSRIKVFYRPPSLTEGASKSFEKVQWRVVQEGKSFRLQAHNPSAFHVTITSLALVTGNQRFSSPGEMIGPGITCDFAMPTLTHPPGKSAQVEFEAINDFGADVLIKQPLIF